MSVPGCQALGGVRAAGRRLPEAATCPAASNSWTNATVSGSGLAVGCQNRFTGRASPGATGRSSSVWPSSRRPSAKSCACLRPDRQSLRIEGAIGRRHAQIKQPGGRAHRLTIRANASSGRSSPFGCTATSTAYCPGGVPAGMRRPRRSSTELLNCGSRIADWLLRCGRIRNPQVARNRAAPRSGRWSQPVGRSPRARAAITGRRANGG